MASSLAPEASRSIRTRTPSGIAVDIFGAIRRWYREPPHPEVRASRCRREIVL